tara:strand:- start:343 stop:507 length:165 start_codon:yes stop_codon:yes gene_type:complete
VVVAEVVEIMPLDVKQEKLVVQVVVLLVEQMLHLQEQVILPQQVLPKVTQVVMV